MTQYPEVALARELQMCYVNVSLITDYDAGLEEVKGPKLGDGDFSRLTSIVTGANSPPGGASARTGSLRPSGLSGGGDGKRQC